MLKQIGVAATIALGLSGALTGVASAETLKWGAARDIYSLDPYSYGDSYTLSFLNHVYEGLVRYDADLQIEPALAASWEQVSDTVWRFHLREGVTFHDGAEFTADDVLASLKRVSDPVSPLRGNLPAYKSSKKVDDYTVDIEMTGPYPLLLNDLTNIHIFDAGWLVDNDSEKPTDVGAQIEGYATYHTNGTGPFRLESRVPDSKTVLLVNENWWDEAAHNIDRIEFVPITSAATRVAALLSGEIDFSEEAPAQDVPRLSAQPELKVMERTNLRTVMLGFNRKPTLDNGSENKFNDLRVRQAFAHALDPKLIQQRIMRGKSRTAGTIVAPDIPGYSTELDTPYLYDPEQSRRLLQEAGAADYPHQFSGGMRQRVVIALALAASPKLVIADEPTTALDVSIQAQVISLLRKLCKEKQTAVMLVTHDMGVIAEAADRVAVIYAGRLIELGPVEQVLHAPRHPYTQGLMASIPSLDGRVEKLSQIDGSMPRLDAIPIGCAFSPRCSHAGPRCLKERPELTFAGEGASACWLNAGGTA